MNHAFTTLRKYASSDASVMSRNIAHGNLFLKSLARNIRSNRFILTPAMSFSLIIKPIHTYHSRRGQSRASRAAVALLSDFGIDDF